MSWQGSEWERNWEHRYRNIVEIMAVRFELKSELVLAIIKVESDGNELAYNPEGKWEDGRWYGFWSKYMKNNPNYKNHPLGRYICLNGAFGLMQVLAVRAVELGFGLNRDPSELWKPEVGIEFGCRNLRMLLDRYKGNIWDAVAAYNQGNNRRFSGGKNKGKYCNHRYVEKVREYYEKYKNKREEQKIKK